MTIKQILDSLKEEIGKEKHEDPLKDIQELLNNDIICDPRCLLTNIEYYIVETYCDGDKEKLAETYIPAIRIEEIIQGALIDCCTRICKEK